MIFQVLALLILSIFYGIYLGKMFVQSKKGIRTHQIGGKKEKKLHTVETLMGIATVSIIPTQLISILVEYNYSPLYIRLIGVVIGMIGDFVFLSAVLTMRDSWRAGIPAEDKTELVTSGIYSWSRNPAFLGFDCMYIGICMLYCNPFTILFSLFAIIMLHMQILQEEKYMLDTFGTDYSAYKLRTCRYLGKR